MTPGARIMAASEILDEIFAGKPAEKALTNWARGSRFAGSKDRAAVRDHVFDGLRCRRSYGAYGGGETGRDLMIGSLRAAGANPDDLFTGEGYAPALLTDEERVAGQSPQTQGQVWDVQDWLVPLFETSLGAAAASEAEALRHRAPAFLRVNLIKNTLEHTVAELSSYGVTVRKSTLSPTALEIIDGPRKLSMSAPYLDGWVELQDAASQAVGDTLPASTLATGARVLDYCAGGGGKTLAMAGRGGAEFFAHDVEPRRMKDLPARAERAGVSVALLESEDLVEHAPFDLVLCDAPCSGSGAWRRAPEGKWALTDDRLKELNEIQDDVLDKAANLTAPGGLLAYVTCSLFKDENEVRVSSFLARSPEWKMVFSRHFSLSDGGDGFFVAHLTRA